MARQYKSYDEDFKKTIVKELLDSGCSWSSMWLQFGQKIYPYDENVNVNIKMYKKGKITMYKKRNKVCSY